MCNSEHDALCIRAADWLGRQGFGVVIREPFRANTSNGERPDVLGFRDGISCLIEVKVNRADFYNDKYKRFRVNPSTGMGDWRFFLSPAGVILPGSLPTGWGLLHATPKTIRKVSGWPFNTGWHHKAPFTGNRQAENELTVSALRRFAVRGMLDVIYDPIDSVYSLTKKGGLCL